MEKSPIIRLPKSQERIIQLKKKLLQYQQRLKEQLQQEDLRYLAPEVIEGVVCGTKYKIAILTKLLKTGEIQAWDYSLRYANYLKGRGISFNAERFNNAAAVIDEYCRNGGKNVQGGSLPK